ncbi:hypothetical protein LCGC14_0873040 [marine sediment metagenome]|uniref:Uncharacterized protein n=1 Tax=marine sediment metagenome TaxID=412755 RepID=A0A0F9RNS4_9ZZZZ
MIIQFHTPKGIVPIDSDTVTDAELAGINMGRQKLDAYLSEMPRDLAAEITSLKVEADGLRTKLKAAGVIQ